MTKAPIRGFFFALDFVFKFGMYITYQGENHADTNRYKRKE